MVSPWSGVSLETISLSYRDLLCQTKSPGIGSNKCRGVGQSVWHWETVSDTQCIDENSSLLIATAEGRQENTSLREESKAVGHKLFSRRARWTGLECGASGNGCCDPLEKTVRYHFRPVDLSIWEWCFSPVGRADMLFLIGGILNMWLSCPLKPSSHCVVGESFIGTIVCSGRGHAQETRYLSLPSLWKYHAPHLYWALYK